MAITFNESYYLQTNPDVALAVSLRQFASGADHFNKLGANELRNPNAVFDSKYYAAQNPDVLTAVSAKTFSSVYAHYLANGLKEGRAPNASLKGFDGADYIAKNPDVATAGFTAATALQHYVQYGVDENRSFTSSTAGAVTGNVSGTTGDDTITPAGGQASTVRVEGGQQGAAGDTLVITSGSASSFQVIDLSNNGGDQNQTRDNTTGTNTGNKVGPVVQGFENVDARQATINMNLTAIDRTSVGNTGSVASAQTGSVIQGGTGRDTLTGNAGADSLVGGVGNDTINGNAGNDSILGGADDDVISGGAGNDTISDEAGNDTVTGDAGNDTITVGAGINSIDGGADNDAITLAADQATSTTVSTIAGGAGDDTIVLNATAITAASRVSVSGGAGNDTITAGLGVETVNAGAGNDTVKFTSTNLGATDVFNGNDGQDIIQLEIPTGSGTNTFVFTPVGTTNATTQFAGFEAIALIDSSGNTNAKQYKLVLTDTFLANNLVSGSFLIDARGLPGGSNLVIDFSGLTAASAALFATGAFRVLASPSTDVRDQNNVGITNSYLVNTSNSLLSATAAFNIFAGDTAITAGSATAYNTDRTVATGAGQAAYTTQGGTSETGSVGGSGGSTFTVTAGGAILTSSVASGATLTAGTGPALTTSNDTVNIISTSATGALNGSVVQDASTTDSDVANVTVSVTPTGATLFQNIETINLNSFGTTTFDLTASSGYNRVNVTGTGTATLGALATGKTVSLSSTGQNLTLSAAATSASLTLELNGVSTTYNDTNALTQVATTNVVSQGSSANTLVLANAIGTALNVSGAQNLTVRAAYASLDSEAIGAGTHTGTLTVITTGNTTAGDTFDASKYTGVDVLQLGRFSDENSIDGAVTVSGLASGTTVRLAGTAAAAGDDLTLAVSGSSLSDTLTLDLARAATTAAGVANATGITFDDLTTTGIETVTLNSAGAGANTVATYINATNGNALKITGNQNLTITDALSTTTASVDASAFTGGLTLTAGGTGLNGIIGGSGADTITTGDQTANVLQITGGKGADTFTDTAGDVVTIIYTATALTGGDVEGVTDTYTNVAAADMLDFTAALEGILKINGVTLAALTGNTALGTTFSTTAGAETNIRFVNGTDAVQIDINGNGVFDAGTDLNIVFANTVNTVTYQFATDLFLFA